MTKIAFILLFLLSYLLDCKAQSTLEMVCRGLSFTSVFMEKFPNGDFIVVNFNSGDNKKLQIIYFNAYGSVNWNKILDIKDLYYVFSVIPTSGNQILITGSASDGAENSSLIIAIDKEGKILWQNLYGIPQSNSGIYTVTKNIKGQILAYGFYSKGNGAQDFGHFLMQLNSNGSIISIRSLYQSGLWGEGFAEKDGGLFINSHEGVQKYNGDGKLEWFYVHPKGFTRTRFGGVDDDNNFYCISDSANNLMLSKFSSSGAQIWQKKMDFTFSNFKIVHNKLVFLGVYNKLTFEFNHTQVFDTEGKWVRALNYRYYQEIVEGLMGRFWLFGSYIQNIYLACTDTDLKTGCTEEVGPIQLKNASYKFTPRNGDPRPLSADVWTVTSEISAATFKLDTICYENKPLPINLGDSTTLCLGDSLLLDAGYKGSEYIWSTGDTTQQIWVKNAGTYSVSVKSAFGESGADTITVKTESKPVIIWKSIQSDNLQPGDQIVLKDESFGVSKRKWILPNGDSSENALVKYQLTENGHYTFTLKITNAAGCTAEKTQSVDVAFYKITFPNAFTPNNDSLNEIFSPQGFGITHYSLDIYNRWGEKVFEGENKGWDGKFKDKPVKEDVYFYKAEIENILNRHIFISGPVYLMR